MKKIILTLLAFSFSLSSMANAITCSGQTTKVSIVLELTGKTFPLDKAEYYFNNKIIPSSGYEFGIIGSKVDQTQKLTYKMRTLKRHPLAKKNSRLALVIKQFSPDGDPFVFILNKTFVSELRLETDGEVILLDRMDCK